MCLIALSYKTHPKYELIVLANRDEFYKRSTESLQYWTREGIYAGKDNIGGGTWMGLNKYGKFVALTNYRDMKHEKTGKKTRGEIVTELLNHYGETEHFFHAFDDEAYNGFNVIVKNGAQFHHYSNVSKKLSPISPGIHGISNALLDTEWPKVSYLKKQLSVMIEDVEIDPEFCFQILQDDTRYPDDTLPETGVGIDLERQLSSAFIKMEAYGTRSSSILAVSYEGQFDFYERSYTDGISDKHYRGKIH